MRESLQVQCSNFISNRNTIKDNFKWESQYIVPVCASIFSAKNIEVTSESLKKCKHIVEDNTGALSYFRGLSKLPIICMMASSENPEGKIKSAQEIYKKAKEEFSRSPYLTLVSMILTDMVGFEETDRYIRRGREIYNRMKKEHPFLTSYEDSVFAILMAFSEKSDDDLIAEMESIYTDMKSTFSYSNAVQSLSHVLSLVDGLAKAKCEKVRYLYSVLKEKKIKYGKNYELPVLGAVSILPVDSDLIVNDIIEADNYLSSQKGYGGFGIPKKIRLMHATMLVINDYSCSNDTINSSAAAITSTLAMVAAQQTAMCAAVAASAAASSASS